MSGKPKDLTNQRFGKLIALHMTDRYSSSYRVWECICECGRIIFTSSGNLLSGNSKSCGICSRVQDLKGQKFGRLLVLSLCSERTNNRGAKWLCQCDCGKLHEIDSKSLKTGHVVSCGCYHKEMVSKLFSKGIGEAGFNSLYGRYKSSSEKRKLIFDITEQEFKTLVTGKCYYCGSCMTQLNVARNKNGNFYYVGIDRLDNGIGYTIENCVPCCKTCNYMKHSSSFNDFILHIRKIYDYTIHIETE